MKRTIIFATALIVWVSASIQAPAQWAAPPPAPPVALRAPPELDQLLAPIALYPDPLIAQILPAATAPGEITLAARYVFGGGNPGQIDYQPWSPGVMAVAHYPDVLRMMDQRLDWTTQLGLAFMYQQADVMAAIQRLRFQAQALGNLRTTPQLCVVDDNGMIEILPANPDMLYVPMYQPDMIFARRGFFFSFGVGFSIGFWLNSDCDWHHHNVMMWSRDHYRPHDWWGRPPRERFGNVAVNSHVTVWRPQVHGAVATVNRADRGWASHDVHPAHAAAVQPVARGAEVHPAARGAEVHPAARAVVEPRAESHYVAPHAAPAPAVHSSGGAFVGGESAHEAHAASSRGQQSRAVAAPAPRPAAPAPSSHGAAASGHKH